MKRLLRTIYRKFTSLLVLSLLFPTTALASACEEAFAHTTEKQAMTLNAADLNPDVEPGVVIETMKQVLAAEGLSVGNAINDDGVMRLYATQKATQTSPEVPLLASAGDETIEIFTVVLMSMKQNSMLRADADYMRRYLCRLLAKATPQGQRLDGNRTSARTAPPSDHPNAKMLRPGMDFDAAAARAALEPGTNVIAGAACANYGGNWVHPSAVILLPMTPYLAEYLRLVKKAKAADKVDADPEMMSIRLIGKTNSKGEFRFADLKAGSYYLYTETAARVEYERDVTVGTTSTPIGSYAIMGKENYINDHYNQIEKVVKVAGEGKTIEVKLTPRNGLFTNNGGAGWFGCR